MSPEQCRGANDVDGASDVYSLGIIFFEMLTGKHPMASVEGEGLIIAMHIYEPAPPIGSIQPAVTKQMQKLVADMLKKERTQRPTMSEVCTILEASNPDEGEVSENHDGQTQDEAPGENKPNSGPLPTSTLGSGSGQVVITGPRARLAGYSVLKLWGIIVLICIIAALSFQMGRLQTSSSQPQPPPPAPTLKAPAPSPVPEPRAPTEAPAPTAPKNVPPTPQAPNPTPAPTSGTDGSTDKDGNDKLHNKRKHRSHHKKSGDDDEADDQAAKP